MTEHRSVLARPTRTLLSCASLIALTLALVPGSISQRPRVGTMRAAVGGPQRIGEADAIAADPDASPAASITSAAGVAVRESSPPASDAGGDCVLAAAPSGCGARPAAVGRVVPHGRVEAASVPHLSARSLRGPPQL